MAAAPDIEEIAEEQQNGITVLTSGQIINTYESLISFHEYSFLVENSSTDENAYFLIKEAHCLGHNESRTISVGDYRKEHRTYP